MANEQTHKDMVGVLKARLARLQARDPAELAARGLLGEWGQTVREVKAQIAAHEHVILRLSYADMISNSPTLSRLL